MPPTDSHSFSVYCQGCRAHFTLLQTELRPKFCPYCKAELFDEMASGISETVEESISLIQEHLPVKEKIQFSIGPYQVIESIGKGGMGEVLLAYDTNCGRRIALKRIRQDLITHAHLHHRFMREARITSQLTHPVIIPIYTIQREQNQSYYTMPFVEGQTLRQILSFAKRQERRGIKQKHVSSIPSLIRIFLSVCQAIAYAHSKGVIHRDLKPNNIIVGRYGEVMILDWGLAKVVGYPETDEDLLDDEERSMTPLVHELTLAGKVVGTVAYMAPERASGQPANYQTDIYSLGVILYQILTLRHPFHRSSLQEFRKNLSKEVLHDPAEIAPYRDVPPILSRVVRRCLDPQIEMRYHTVDELIHDIETYVEGRSDWFQMTSLSVKNKEDWEFQENVLIAEHIAITRGTEISDWVNLMVSKASFPGNVKIEARVRIGENGHGVGFLLSVPEVAERTHLNAGYCLWIASDLNKSTKLLRATVEVVEASEVFLQRGESYIIRIEKMENNIHFYINNVLQFSYISHLPLSGTHIGLLARDADFTLENLTVHVGGHSLTLSCLAIPDAFLAHKDYLTALNEYRRIGYSFPGTAEGREAMFRAGVTLLEEARDLKDPMASHKKSEEALEEFGKLHGTSGAPLEYLGKSLVYEHLGEYEEEVKCFELSFRRYPNHPLLPFLQEQLIHRMHESSRQLRKATYHFILLAVRYLPPISTTPHILKIFNSLKKSWESLYFIGHESLCASLPDYLFFIQLSFWLEKSHVVLETIENLLKLETFYFTTVCSAVFVLIELKSWELAEHALAMIEPRIQKLRDEEYARYHEELEWMRIAVVCHRKSLLQAKDLMLRQLKNPPKSLKLYPVIHLMEEAIEQRQLNIIHELAQSLNTITLSPDYRLLVDSCLIWACLLERNWDGAHAILQRYPLEFLIRETSILHVLYGCWLCATEAKEIAMAHFSSVLEVAFPRSWILLSYFINRKPEELQLWLNQAFGWEKKQLYKQFSLFYHCLGDEKKSAYYRNL